MTFINDDKYLLACLEIVELEGVVTRLQTIILKVGMETHLVLEFVLVKA